MPKRHRYSLNQPEPPSTISVGKPLPVPRKRLTAKQERFAEVMASEYYFGDLSILAAAEKAGYSKKTALAESYQMLDPKKHPHVAERVKELRAEYSKKYGITYEKHIRDLQIIRDAALADKAYAAAVSAEYRRGQAQGDIYINKLEVRKGNIDSMSKEEVLEELEKLGVRPIATLEGESSRIEDAEDADFEEIEDEAGEPVLDKSAEADSTELNAFLESK